METVVYVALLSLAQAAHIEALPVETCPVAPESLRGTTIELVSQFAPFTRETFNQDGTYVFLGHGMSTSGRWFRRGDEICTTANDFTGCGEYRMTPTKFIYIVTKDRTVAKYVQRRGGKIVCE
jgi:hypothetical protein